MTIPTALTILFSVFLSVVAQMLLKYGMTCQSVQNSITKIELATIFIVLTNPWIIGGLSAYVISAAFWLMVLSKIDVSQAYPFVGLGFIGTMLAAYFFFNEPLTTSKAIGTILVVCGILLIAR